MMRAFIKKPGGPIVAAGVLLLLASPVLAERGSGSICGRVYDENTDGGILQQSSELELPFLGRGLCSLVVGVIAEESFR